MTIKRSKFCFILILIFLPILFAGCTNLENKINPKGQLKISIQIPDLLYGTNELQFVNQQITLSSLTITISQGETILSQTIPITESIINVVFNNLLTGEWNVIVDAIDMDGYKVFTGTNTGTVQFNTLTPVDITLRMLSGDLNVQVIYPEELAVTYGTITLINLVHPEANITNTLEFNSNVGTTSFSQLAPTTWPVKVQLFNAQNEVIASGQSSIDILPGRITTAELNL